MANFISSALLAYQSKISKQFNEAELRERQNPILKRALSAAPKLIANTDSVKQSDKRSVYGYYLKRMTADNGTARSYQPVGVQGDSGQVALNWITFSEKVGINIQSGMDNIFDTANMLEYELSEKQRILRERIGIYIVTQLHANRTQVAPYTTTIKNGAWNATNFAFENASGQSNFYFENAASILRQNKYYGKLDAVVDPVIFKSARFTQYQREGNAQNLDYQYQQYNTDGIMEHAVLGQEVSTEYANGTGLIMPANSFSVIPWNPLINRQGKGDYDDFNGGWGVLKDDSGLPYNYSVFGWTQRSDTSGAGGVVQDWQTNIELSIDIAFNTAPMSTTGETPIYEFGQL